jgi:hypothetical protein
MRNGKPLPAERLAAAAQVEIDLHETFEVVTDVPQHIGPQA